MKCPKCREDFNTIIDENSKTWLKKGIKTKGMLLCLCCMSIFTKKGKVIEKG